MFAIIFAIIIELFFDYFPDGAPIEHYGPVGGILEKVDMRPWKEKNEDHLWVFWNLGPRLNGYNFTTHPKEQLVLFTWEPPTVQPELHDPRVHEQFGKVFTWDDDLVDNKKYFKFFYPVLKGRIPDVIPFKDKKFCTLIARRLGSKHPKQLYKEREKTIRFFDDKEGEFDLYGHFWGKKKLRKNWRGPIPDKNAVLKGYKFSICYENTKDIKGYITEKIFDCFAAGVVPVYWGASNVTDYIPEECFIDRRKFKDNKKLYQFLKSITEKEYNQYLDAAEAFLKSEKAQLFSQDHFTQNFLKVLVPETKL